MRILKGWRDVAKLTGEAETDAFKQHEASLDRLWDQLGFGRGADGAGEPEAP